MALTPVYEASDGTIIGVVKGKKSRYNFKVKYRQLGKRERTPKHVHITTDLYIIFLSERDLTLKLIKHIIDNILRKVRPANSFPCGLQIFQESHARRYEPLNDYGDYPVDVLLLITELIQIQEKTNYPEGTMNLEVFTNFYKHAISGDIDIFTLISAAT